MKDHIITLLKTALIKLAEQNVLSEQDIPETFAIERTKDPAHGDFASNIAMVLAKKASLTPRDLAQKIIALIPLAAPISKIDIAGPGFINVTLTKDSHLQIISAIIDQGQNYGHSNVGNSERIHIEYVSSNPTGPLHVGHGRGAAYGSCVVNLLRATGFHVHSEYYVNDAGRQMDILATSVWLRYLELNGVVFTFPRNGYKGDYVFDIARLLQPQYGMKLVHQAEAVFHSVPLDEPEGGDKEAHIDGVIANAKLLLGHHYKAILELGLHTILADMKEDLAEFGVTYDEWFSEKQLADKGLVNHCINVLIKAKHLYEKDGALWFNTTAYGDDKDRVVRRANGQTTYFASDIAYHLNKLERGYNTLINVLGADHHGYIARLKAGIKAMTGRDNALITPIVQFVSLYRGAEKASMSTRGGDFVTLRELRNEVGNDVARYFYIMRKIDVPLDFDLELATSQSNENPVYYIQYAHARICSVWRQLETQGLAFDQPLGLASLDRLETREETALCKHLQAYAEVIQRAALAYEPHQLAHYLYELANCYHSYYTTSKCLVDDAALRNARLCLNKATQQILINGLGLLGISAPKVM